MYVYVLVHVHNYDYPLGNSIVKILIFLKCLFSNFAFAISQDLSDAEKILAEFSSPSSSSSVEQLRFHKASESSSKQADLDQSLLKSGGKE